jgi:hypothetical protein
VALPLVIAGLFHFRVAERRGQPHQSLTAGKLSNVVMVAVMRKSGLHSVPIAQYSLG